MTATVEVVDQPKPRRSRKDKGGENAEAKAALGDLEENPEEAERSPAGPTTPAQAADVKADMNPAPTPPAPKEPDELGSIQAVVDAPEVKTVSPAAAKKLGTILGRKVPGAEHIEVSKRTETGGLAYVGSYSAADLSESQSIQSFLDRWVKKRFGAGEYQVFGVAADGKRYDCGVVHLLEPMTERGGRRYGTGEGSEATGSGDRIIDLLQRQLERRDREVETRRPNADPIETAERLHSLTEKIGGGAKGEAQSMMAVVVHAMTEQGRQLAQMMAKSEERMLTLLQNMNRKEHDPLTLALLEKLFSREERSSAPLPPPPPPPPDPVLSMKALAETLALLTPKAADPTAMFELILKRADQDRLSMKDVIELVRGSTEQPGTDDFRKSLDNLTLVFEQMGRLRQATEPNAPGFWDAIGQLLSHRELAGSIASAIRVKATTPGAPPQPQLPRPRQAPALPSDIERRAAEIQRRRLELEERKLALEEAAIARLSADKGASRVPAPAPTAPAQDSPPKAPPAGAQSSLATELGEEDEQAVVERVRAQHGGKIPPLPEDIGERVNAFVMAKDDEGLVDAAAKLVLHLVGFEDWKPYGDLILANVARGNAEQAFAYIEGLLEGLGSIGLMQKDLVKNALRAVSENFGVFVEKLDVEIGGASEDENEGDEEKTDS